MKTIITVLVVLTSITMAFATNPADLTGGFRYLPGHFYKFAYDGGPWSVCAYAPIGDSACVSLFNWNSESGDSNLYELTLSKQLGKGFEVGLIGDWHSAAETTSETRAYLDYRKDALGLGLIVPLDSDSQVAIGPRLYLGDVALFTSFQENNKPVYGVSFCTKTKVETAYKSSSDAWILRVSRPFNRFIPELRTEFKSESTTFGFGLGYAF